MAKRKTATASRARVSTGKGNDVVVVNAPAPARRSSPRRAPAKRKSRRRVGGAVKRYEGASLKGRMTAMALGGFALGFIEDWMSTSPTGMKIPTIPMLGRKGTIAAAVYFLNPKMKILQDAGVAAAAIAGHELGRTGSISGEPHVTTGFDDFEVDDSDDEGDFDDE
jgi:hypothetical protein